VCVLRESVMCSWFNSASLLNNDCNVMTLKNPCFHVNAMFPSYFVSRSTPRRLDLVVYIYSGVQVVRSNCRQLLESEFLIRSCRLSMPARLKHVGVRLLLFHEMAAIYYRGYPQRLKGCSGFSQH